MESEDKKRRCEREPKGIKKKISCHHRKGRGGKGAGGRREGCGMEGGSAASGQRGENLGDGCTCLAELGRL